MSMKTELLHTENLYKCSLVTASSYHVMNIWLYGNCHNKSMSPKQTVFKDTFSRHVIKAEAQCVTTFQNAHNITI